MVEVSESAAARSIAWIKTVEESISEFGGDALAKKVLKCTGNKCAEQIFNDCTEILGRKPETVDELLYAMNRRRGQKLNINSLWKREENRAHLKIPDECGCTLVKAGLAKPNPIHCLCSQGMMEQIFSYVCKGDVHVEVVNAVGYGNDCCEFVITFEE